MKNKDTLNLEASQAIASLGIECESEKYWVKHRQWKKKNKKMVEIKPVWILELWGEITQSDYYPAFSPQELFSALPAIGEKLKWGDITFKNGITKRVESPDEQIDMKELKYHTLNLLDTFTTNYDMEDISKEIIRLIKE